MSYGFIIIFWISHAHFNAYVFTAKYYIFMNKKINLKFPLCLQYHLNLSICQWKYYIFKKNICLYILYLNVNAHIHNKTVSSSFYSFFSACFFGCLLYNTIYVRDHFKVFFNSPYFLEKLVAKGITVGWFNILCMIGSSIPLEENWCRMSFSLASQIIRWIFV